MFGPKVLLPCIALDVASSIMQASGSVIALCFNSAMVVIWRWGYDDSDQCHAGCHAAADGCWYSVQTTFVFYNGTEVKVGA